jgi:hypothetical protein
MMIPQSRYQFWRKIYQYDTDDFQKNFNAHDVWGNLKWFADILVGLTRK